MAAVTLPAPVVSAWQAALAGEHAAIFGYGTLGPRLPPVRVDRARAFQREHRALRDAVMAAMTGQSVQPVEALADYPSPFPLSSGPRADGYAQRLEEDCAAAWRYLVAAAAGVGPQTPQLTTLRASAVAALSASAVRATYWRAILTPAHPTLAFPGVG
jgi:Domain of unknown function (DUF4439)